MTKEEKEQSREEWHEQVREDCRKIAIKKYDEFVSQGIIESYTDKDIEDCVNGFLVSMVYNELKYLEEGEQENEKNQ